MIKLRLAARNRFLAFDISDAFTVCPSAIHFDELWCNYNTDRSTSEAAGKLNQSAWPALRIPLSIQHHLNLFNGIHPPLTKITSCGLFWRSQCINSSSSQDNFGCSHTKVDDELFCETCFDSLAPQESVEIFLQSNAFSCRLFALAIFNTGIYSGAQYFNWLLCTCWYDGPLMIIDAKNWSLQLCVNAIMLTCDAA